MKNMRLLALLALVVQLGACLAPGKPGPEAAAGQEAEASSGATAELEPKVFAWKASFSRQAAYDEENRKEEASPTGYGGSVPFQRASLMPELATNFEGSPFAKDYKEDRGHAFAFADLLESGRVGAKTPGACLSCKTSDMASVYAKEGWVYAKRPLADLVAGLGEDPESHRGIDCFTCHDPGSRRLRTVQPGFAEAMARRGVDLERASEEEMKTFVCAQCHSEYYFEPVTTRVVHPWDEGLEAESMYAYYAGKPSGFTADFTNPRSGLSLLKAQHPDYEEFSGGTHGAAGVTCVDCHMPAVAEEGGKVTRHRVTSPLRTIEASCLPCHEGKAPSYLLERVRRIQDTVYRTQRIAGRALADAHEVLARAKAEGARPEALAKAGEALRHGQWLWDFVASANSMGFHDPLAAQGNLARAIELAYQAESGLR